MKTNLDYDRDNSYLLNMVIHPCPSFSGRLLMGKDINWIPLFYTDVIIYQTIIPMMA